MTAVVMTSSAPDVQDDDELEYRQRHFMAKAVKFGRIAALLVVIWLLTGGPFSGSFWPIWPIAVFGFILAKQASRLGSSSARHTSFHGGHRHRHGCFF